MMHDLTMPAWLQNITPNKADQVPAWLADFRQAQWEALLKKGLPTRQDERFKYADFSFLTNKDFSLAKKIEVSHLYDVIHQHRLQQGDSILLVLVNGHFMPSLSDLHKLPTQVIACRLSEAIKTHAALIKPEWITSLDTQKYPFASLNAALATDGLFFYLQDQCELTIPIHLLSMVIGQDEWMAHPQHLFVLGEQSQLTLVEEHFTLADQAYLMNLVSTFVVEKAATLNYCKIQHEGKNAIHMAHTFVQQKQDSMTTLTHFSSGGLFARDEVRVNLNGQRAHCRTSGFYHLSQVDQYMDHHIDIHHLAPLTQSEMLYKGILDNKSCAVFNGRLYVEKGAQKILAHQANHNLLLANDAEVYSKPELEIYADDVKCKHGATTGQLNQEALFYLRSRGIAKEDAVHMLLAGFAEEIMQQITHAGIKMRVEELMSL